VCACVCVECLCADSDSLVRGKTKKTSEKNDVKGIYQCRIIKTNLLAMFKSAKSIG